MRRLLVILGIGLLGFAVAGCASDQIQRPGRPARPDRPGWMNPYPGAGSSVSSPDRLYRARPGLVPW